MKRVVIIGGGIAGLAAAYSLRETGTPCEIVLIERKERLGGNIRTDRVDGFLIEGGPDCFLSEKPWAIELCKKIGLGDKLLPTNEEHKKTFVLSRGRLHELPEGFILMVPTRIMPFLASSLITLPGKIRMGLEYFIPPKKDDSDESLADFVRRRLGREALEKIAEPLVAGVHAGDPETMSVRASFPRFVKMEKEYGSLIKGMLKRMSEAKKKSGKRMTMFVTLKDGLSELIERLTEIITATEATRILTGTAAAGISEEDGRFVVKIEGGEPVSADSVVIAAPAHGAACLVEGLDSALSEKLREIPYVSTATVSLAYKKKDVPHPLDGFGFVVPRVEGRRIMASTWTSVKFKYRAPEDSVLIRCFLGGAKNSAILGLGDRELVEISTEELRDIMGITAGPIFTRVYRWMNSMPQYIVGHEERIREIENLAARHPGLFLTGSAYHGIGIPDTVRLGEEAARRVAEHLSSR